MKADLRDALRAARADGWSVEPTGGGHLRLTHPIGGLVFAPATPSCPRAVPNMRAQLRRALRRGPGLLPRQQKTMPQRPDPAHGKVRVG